MAEPGSGTQRLLGELVQGVRGLERRQEKHEETDEKRHNDNRADYAGLSEMVERRLRAIEDKMTERKTLGKAAKWLGRGFWAIGGGGIIAAATKLIPAALR